MDLLNELDNIDVRKAATEVKTYLDARKMDLIDWNYTKIECYPDPTDDDYPELKRFARLWNDFFDYAESCTIDDKGTGFPFALVEKFEARTKQVEAEVNGDDIFWNTIRDEVMPLYSSPDGVEISKNTAQSLAGWKDRWQKIEFVYDPIGMSVETKQKVIDARTGDNKGYRKIRERYLPPGFIIRIL